jgi:hypothetical protein
MQLTWIPVKNSTIQYQMVEHQAVLVMPVEGKVKVLNHVGAFIWDKIDGILSLNDLIKSISDTFEIQPDQAAFDLIEFLQELKQKNMVQF